MTKNGQRFKFCAGKATWSEEIADLYRKCFIAYSTGILPSRGGFEDQDALFCDVFDAFVRAWDGKRYHQIWGDVRDYVESVLKAIFGKKK